MLRKILKCSCLMLLAACLPLAAEPTEDLRAAISDSDAARVRAAIAAGAKVNSRDSQGLPPIILAMIGNGDPEIVRLLIAAKADINIKDNDGKPTLMYAMESGAKRTDIVRLLISAKVNVNAADKDGWTALTQVHGDIELARMLLRAKADINAGGGQALLSAAAGQLADMVRFLIKSGANVNARDAAGKTILKRFQESLGEGAPDEAGIGRILRSAGAKEQ